jgi:hypothetical protein
MSPSNPRLVAAAKLAAEAAAVAQEAAAAAEAETATTAEAPPSPPVVEPLTGVAKMKAERAAAVAALTIGR